MTKDSRNNKKCCLVKEIMIKSKKDKHFAPSRLANIKFCPYPSSVKGYGEIAGVDILGVCVNCYLMVDTLTLFFFIILRCTCSLNYCCLAKNGN